jgi:guanosine-3',5'-bis(diphosphate) 3'-pyrophosphohydrolase
MPPSIDTRRFLDALNFAALRHRTQRRKGERGAPYVNHLIEVANILASHGLEETELLCAAVLHDVIEDAEVTAEEVRQRFGNRIASIVLEVTDDPGLPTWQQKLEQIETAGAMSEPAQNLRVADKISNLRGILTSPPVSWSLERKIAYYAWAEQVVSQCRRADETLLRTFETVHETGSAALQMKRPAGTLPALTRPLPAPDGRSPLRSADDDRSN